MKKILGMFALAALLTTGGCRMVAGLDHFDFGVSKHGEKMSRAGHWVDGWISLDGLKSYDGKVIDVGLFHKADRDDWVSLDVWPLAGAGVGWLGAHARVLPLEVGLGLFDYASYPCSKAGKCGACKAGKPCKKCKAPCGKCKSGKPCKKCVAKKACPKCTSSQPCPKCVAK